MAIERLATTIGTVVVLAVTPATPTLNEVPAPKQTGAPALYTPKSDDKYDRFGVTAIGDGSNDSGGGDRDDGPRDRYFREDATSCNLGDLEEVELVQAAGACPDGTFEVVIEGAGCEPGAVELGDLWVQRVQADGSFAEPEVVSVDDCVTPEDVAVAAERAFAEMRIVPPVAAVQGRRPLLVNVHYPARVEAGAVSEEVSLLGVPVVIRAEPVEFRWDFDDPYSVGGGTLTTTSPGRAWQEGDDPPDGSWVGHRYTALGDPERDAGTLVDAEGDRYRDDVTVTLTSVWRGMFSLAGTSVWTPIDGTVTTTSTVEPVTVTEARVRLVCDDLVGRSTC